jgi:hypothetical protein
MGRITRNADGSVPRSILVAMMVDPTTLSKAASNWTQPFKDRHCNTIGGWCVKFWRRYGKPPMKHVEQMFAAWADKNRNQADVDLMEELLKGLPGQYQKLAREINSDHMVDVMSKYFTACKIEKAVEAAQGHIAYGEEDKALEKLTSLSRIDLAVEVGFRPFNDPDEITSTFEARRKPLVKYDAGLGEFFGNALERDSFTAFIAPDKVGKSFWLIDVAYRAVQQKKRTAHFLCGDMSKRQIKERLYVRVAEHPRNRPGGIWKPEDPLIVKVPTKIIRPKGQMVGAVVKHVERQFLKPLNEEIAQRAAAKFINAVDGFKPRSRGGKKEDEPECYYRMEVHPSGTLSVSMIRESLMRLAREEGWVVDCVVIDYSDLLAPPADAGRFLSPRDVHHANWMAMSSLRTELHVALVTASQSDAAAYGKVLLDRTNFSEDKRKLSHVSSMVGINQVSDEKSAGVYRLNMIVNRDEDFDITRCCYTGACLQLANPAVVSIFPTKASIYGKGKEDE